MCHHRKLLLLLTYGLAPLEFNSMHMNQTNARQCLHSDVSGIQDPHVRWCGECAQIVTDKTTPKHMNKAQKTLLKDLYGMAKVPQWMYGSGLCSVLAYT